MGKRSKTAQKAFDIAEPLVKALGLDLVDVSYAKEGGKMFLRLYVDKRGGVGIDDCETVSKATDSVLEKELGLDYDYFEVSSPGLTRPLETVSDYLDLSKDETFEPAMFTFEVVATETNVRSSKVLYRKQVSINIDGPDTVGKTEVLKDLPAGSYAWVTEIYQGAHYQVNTSANTGPIEVKADKIEVVNGKTTLTEQPDATATFDNKNNDTHRGGHGIENIFTYNGTNWTDKWTTEPGTAEDGGAV